MWRESHGKHHPPPRRRPLADLHAQAGIEGGHALAARRTFAVRLNRKGYDIRHIAELLGHSTITATKRLIDDYPVRLSDLVSGVI